MAGAGSQEILSQLLNYTHKAESENFKWGEALNSKSLPPVRPLFLKVPQLPETSPQTGDQLFKYISPSGTLLKPPHFSLLQWTVFIQTMNQKKRFLPSSQAGIWS